MENPCLNPSEEPEPPECCGEVMGVLKNGTCLCPWCGTVKKPAPDIDPEAFADVELPPGYLRQL